MYQGSMMRESGMREYNRKSHTHKMEDANRDYPLITKNGFKVSGGGHQYSESIQVLSIQKLNQIAQIQVENKLSTIFNTVEIKLLHKYGHALNAIKTSHQFQLAAYQQLQSTLHTVTAFVSQIDWTIKEKVTREMVFCWLKLMGNCKKENSKRQMLRINSRLNHEANDAEAIDRNNHEHNPPSEKVNRLLLKRKEKREREMGVFKSQMEGLLGQYQNYLKKN